MSAHTPHGPKSLVTEDMKATAQALQLALEPFVELNPHLPIQYLMTFLKVVEEEGKGVGDYAKAAGIGTTIMTRHLLDIGERDRHGGEGYALIYQKRDPMDLRVNRSYVAAKGAAAMNRARRALDLLVGKLRK